MARDTTKESKTYQIGKQILSEQDLRFDVEVAGGVFTMKLPSPLERAAIEAEIAQRLGASRDRCSAEHIGLVEVTTYVNNLVVDSPAWFTSAWTCHSEEVITTLYQKYLAFDGEFQRKIKAGEFTRGS